MLKNLIYLIADKSPSETQAHRMAWSRLQVKKEGRGERKKFTEWPNPTSTLGIQLGM